MDAPRARSLLAWLAGFELTLAAALTPLKEEEAEAAAVADALLLPLLGDGAVLRRAALTGEAPLLLLPPPPSPPEVSEVVVDVWVGVGCDACLGSSRGL